MAESTRIKKPLPPKPANWLDAKSADAWHSTAPAEIIEAYTMGEGQEGWEIWTDHLEGRKGRQSLSKLLPDGENSLLWGMPAGICGSETADLVRQLSSDASFTKRQRRRRWADLAADWLDAASIASASPAYAYECLAWTSALTRLASCIGENLWWKLVNHLVAIAREARQHDGARDTLAWQLLGGELPLSLAYYLPEIRVCHDLSLSAWSQISAGLNELVDIDGVPLSDRSTLASYVSCWLRCRVIAEKLGEDLWQDPASRRFELALLSLARLSGMERGLASAAQKLDLEKPVLRLLSLFSDGKITAKKLEGLRRLPSPAMHSEDSRLGFLRTDWTDRSPRLTINYKEDLPNIELHCGEEVIWSGNWRLEISLDGHRRSISGNWDTVCWHSDRDVDYLEIEASLEGGVTVQRQILLAREDELLLLADAVVSEHPGRIEYHSSLPIAAQIGFHGAEDTREGHLAGESTRLLTLPLSLPEWRCETQLGNLEVTNDTLTIRQFSRGTGLYAPLLFDLNSQRSREETTWRKLTVASQRTALSSDVATGYRAQIGDTNWLIYRSMAEPAIRSLLGQQVKAEFLFARMKRNGSCKRLLEIEPMDD